MVEIPARIKRFFETVSVPMTLATLTEPDCPLVLANAGFQELTGYTPDQVIGRNCRFLQGGLDQPDARADVRDVIASGRDGQVILKNFTASGVTFDNLLFLYPIHMDETPAFVLGSQFALKQSKPAVGALRHDAAMRENLLRLSRESSRLQIATRRATSDTLALLVRGWLTDRSPLA